MPIGVKKQWQSLEAAINKLYVDHLTKDLSFICLKTFS